MVQTGSCLVLGVIAGMSLCACRAPARSRGPIRLVDLHRPQAVEGKTPSPAALTPVEWRGAAEPAGSRDSKSSRWTAGPGVQGLAVRDGRLVGRATTDLPIIHLEQPPSKDQDLVHEVHVRMRASAGSSLAVALRATEKVDLQNEGDVLRVIPWPFNSPIGPGDEMQTYVMRTSASLSMTAARHVLLRPTDSAGATFEVESVRVVSRREHLAGVSSGLGWHGLSDVYRESLVARAPETLRFDVTLPAWPRLQLAVGTIEESPVTFRVGVRDEKDGEERVLLERTVTVPHRWDTAAVDLTAFAGRTVALSLALASEKAGALGFWGAPVIRDTAAEGPRPQGVILIWADTLRRDRLPSYGYSRPTAPALAGMAAEGTLFEDCIAQASWTKASGPSLLTSLYASSHGVHGFNDLLPSSATTIAEVYRQAGYATMGLTAITFVGKFSNLHQGFEELHESSSFPERQAGSSKTARPAVDRLLPWLEAHRDVPFFVLLHVADPHSPFKPNPPYDALFADPRGREEHERQAEAVRRFIANPLMRRFGMPTREELVRAGIDPEAYVAYEKDWYDGSIRGMDTEIGRLLERLRELGLDRRTLVALVSDHGEEFLEHGRMFHGQNVYGEMASVPLVLWWPGVVPAGARVAQTVQNIDLMPTLLELSGIPAPAGVQGASLVPLFRSGASGSAAGRWQRPAITEKPARGAPPPQNEASIALALDGWKLVHHAVRPAGRPEYELFDRGKDPLDLVDVAAQHPEIVARLSRELQAWRRMAESARLKPDAAVAREVSGEELERLRALGYVQ